MENDPADNAFQKKFSEFSEVPHQRVWERIEQSLNRKNAKRVFPLWWIGVGAAALVLLGFFTLGPAVGPQLGPAERTPLVSSPTHLAIPNKTDPPIVKIPVDTQKQSQTIKGIPNIPSSTIPSKPSPSKEVAEFISSTSKITTEGGNTTKTIPSERSANTQTASSALHEEHTVREEAVASSSGLADWAITSEEAAEPEIRTPETGQRWGVGPSIAPVYYRWTGSGSPISPAFAGNSKTGLVNFSYGLSVSYAVSKKLNLRSGINRLDLGYQTNEVAFTSAFVSRSSSLIRTINYNESSKNVIVQSAVTPAQELVPNSASDLFAPSPEQQGDMVQQFGYLEVPLELQYALLKKSWGLNLIGGFSSLFLLDNRLSLDSGGDIMEIGSATNMNSLNFSTNIGLGAYYMFTPDFQFSVQPMFKWHLNTFSETSGEFRPYTLGIYSGFNFKF